MVSFGDVVERQNLAGSSFITVQGLDEAVRAMRAARSDAVGELREVYREAGKPIAAAAAARVPNRSGKLAGSVKSAPTQTQGRVKAGTAKRVPYAGWIEFGGTIFFPNRTARRGGSARKGRFSQVERTSVGGFRRRRVTQVRGTGAVVLVRPFIPGGRYVWPVVRESLPVIRHDMTSKIEALFRREGLL